MEMEKLRLVSWNTAKRLNKVSLQADFMRQICPDIIALQEIIPSTEGAFRRNLSEDYPFIISSFELAPDLSILNKKRMFGQLIASKYKLRALPPKNFNVPWTERILSVSIALKDKKFDLHTTHIPPGSSNGWVKIEMITGIVEYFKNQHQHPQILCGDFNTPQFENVPNGIVTFGQRVKTSGEVVMKGKFRGGLGIHWDNGERSLFDRLNQYGLVDVFRMMHPNALDAYSWEFKRGEKVFRTRFDHFFGDKRLTISNCKYLNRQGNLSDHSPIVADFYL